MNPARIPLLRAAAWSKDPLEPAPANFVGYDAGTPDASAVDPILRRRLSPLGRGMIHCAARAGEGRGPLRTVFASQHGEPGRAMPMLEDIAAGLDISPTQFSMNVLNAVAGLWSIARKDPSEATALSAGPESFGWGLLEAHSIHQATGQPVLFVFGDDALPPPLSAPLQAPLHALALLVGQPAARWLALDRAASAPSAEPALPQSLHALLSLSGSKPGPWAGPRGAWTFELD